MGAVCKRLAQMMLFIVVLSGCSEELYSGLTEKEGNQMLSILLDEGIRADKVVGQKGQTVTLMVAKEDLSRAIRVLKDRGYPRDDFDSVGELFEKEGMISSPLEERARYVYGLSQEMSETLSQLDGVITARVHVVLPSEAKKNAPQESPSASVFIKYANSVNIEDFVPQIKMLVNNGIEGLSYDNISVALFPAQVHPVKRGPGIERVFLVDVAENSVSRFYGLIVVGSILLGLALTGNLLLYKRLDQQSKKQSVLE